MNLAEALITALPDLPVATVTNRKPRFSPEVVVREELDENGDPMAVMLVPDRGLVYRVPQIQYELLKSFDGQKTFAEVGQAFQSSHGIAMSEQQLQELYATTQDTGLWFQSAQEKNITLSQKLKEERNRRSSKKNKYGDLSHMVFKGWDPNEFLNWLHPRAKFIYSGWFTALTLCLFAFTFLIWVDRWSEIGRDTLQYYTFTEKSAQDLAEFWVLFLGIGFFHELAHALTCKHFGGDVHNIGFQLIYLTPAFAAEITEVWVRTGKWQRIGAIIAGIWIETLFCAVATLVWWGTPAGTAAHEWAYKVMLITGLIVIVVNLNPLIKLDGYYALCELIGIQDLKEKSTAFVSAWVRRHIYRLPVEVDYIPHRRKWFFIGYALVSGVYSYSLLYAVTRFAYNVFNRFSPEWSIWFALGIFWLIFRNRIKRLGAFMKTVYLDKRDWVRTWMTRPRLAALAIAALVVLFAPVWHKKETALFSLEPGQIAVLRAEVAGRVEGVTVHEGSTVRAGETLLKMRNLEVESELAAADAELSRATSRRSGAQLTYASLGPAQHEWQRAVAVKSAVQSKYQKLEVKTPITGVVVTPRLEDLQERYVAEGELLVEIEDAATLKARLYLPEYEVRHIRQGAEVSIRPYASWSSIEGRVDTIAAAPAELGEGLSAKSSYRGLKPPSFYVVNVLVQNSGTLRSGMSGTAKILVGRQSIAGKVWEAGRDFAAGRFW